VQRLQFVPTHRQHFDQLIGKAEQAELKIHAKKPKPKPTCLVTWKNCSYECVNDCAQLLYTVQHRTVPTIFPLILQTVVKVRKLPTAGKDKLWTTSIHSKFTLSFSQCLWSATNQTSNSETWTCANAGDHCETEDTRTRLTFHWSLRRDSASALSWKCTFLSACVPVACHSLRNPVYLCSQPTYIYSTVHKDMLCHTVKLSTWALVQLLTFPLRDIHGAPKNGLFLKVCNCCICWHRSVPYITLISSLSGVRPVFCMILHLNILRTVSVKQHYTKSNK